MTTTDLKLTRDATNPRRRRKSVDEYIVGAKMEALAARVTECAREYGDSAAGMDAHTLLQAIGATYGKAAGPQSARASVAAEKYFAMRAAMDEFIREGKVPAGLALKLSERVLDRDL